MCPLLLAYVLSSSCLKYCQDTGNVGQPYFCNGLSYTLRKQIWGWILQAKWSKNMELWMWLTPLNLLSILGHQLLDFLICDTICWSNMVWCFISCSQLKSCLGQLSIFHCQPPPPTQKNYLIVCLLENTQLFYYC